MTNKLSIGRGLSTTALVAVVGLSVGFAPLAAVAQPAQPGKTPTQPPSPPRPSSTPPNPNNPGTPVQPNRPGQPVTPGSNPSNPNSPTNPTTPQNPGTPNSPGTPNQPGQPVQPGQTLPGQSQPGNPTLPPPINPGDTTVPGTGAPGTGTGVGPAVDGNGNVITNPGTLPGTFNNGVPVNGQTLGLGDPSRNIRPFAFQSALLENRFNDSTRRLMQMEQRMEANNRELLQKLGETRLLSGERQNAALLDLLQQILQRNADMQQYLVMSRTSWTGDMDMPGAAETTATINNQNATNGMPTGTRENPVPQPAAAAPGTTNPNTNPGAANPNTTNPATTPRNPR